MLTYLDKELTKKERKKVIRYMTQYRNLDAIIESKRMDLYPSQTTSYEEKPSQRSNAFHSEAEDFAIKKEEIDDLEHVKKKLDLAYQSVKPLQQMIWIERFVEGRNDTDVHYGHQIARKTYYREKAELINVVAECLGTI